MLLRRPVRQKRLRTSFKHHELRIMKSYFALNHNPDAKDLKQLSIKTGLSKRVLQVHTQRGCCRSLSRAHRLDLVNTRRSLQLSNPNSRHI